MYFAMAGAAEVALGQHERALEHLSQARAEMDRQMVTNDWYCLWNPVDVNKRSGK